MNTTGIVDIDAATAARAMRAAAFTIGEEFEGAGRVIVHTLAGPFGADWDLDSAVAVLADAQRIAWQDSITRHDLAVVTAEGRLLRFDVPRPERAS